MSWTGLDSSLRQPTGNRRRVEKKQRAPLDVRDPPLRDEPSDVSHADPEVLRHIRDVHEVRCSVGAQCALGCGRRDTPGTGGRGSAPAPWASSRLIEIFVH
jgi:hypothetical protein